MKMALDLIRRKQLGGPRILVTKPVVNKDG